MSHDSNDRVLDPEDLDVTDSAHVRTLDDDRFVVSTESGPPRAPSPAHSGADDDGDPGTADRRRADVLTGSGDDYGFDAVLALGGETTRCRMTSDDVAETFEALLVWFARNAGGELPPAETLGVLLGGMDAPVCLPEREIHRALARHGLSRDDSIGDLLVAVRDERGLTLE